MCELLLCSSLADTLARTALMMVGLVSTSLARLSRTIALVSKRASHGGTRLSACLRTCLRCLETSVTPHTRYCPFASDVALDDTALKLQSSAILRAWTDYLSRVLSSKGLEEVRVHVRSCMCVCVCVCVRVCVRAGVCFCARVRGHTHVCARVHTHTYACMRVNACCVGVSQIVRVALSRGARGVAYNFP